MLLFRAQIWAKRLSDQTWQCYHWWYCKGNVSHCLFFYLSVYLIIYLFNFLPILVYMLYISLYLSVCLSLTRYIFQGILVEVEYLPAIVPVSCWNLIAEFMRGFLGSCVSGLNILLLFIFRYLFRIFLFIQLKFVSV